MWRGGCIIRSRFLGDIKSAFEKNSKLVNLLLDPFFKKATHNATRLRNVIATAAKKAPVPALSTAWLLRRLSQ